MNTPPDSDSEEESPYSKAFRVRKESSDKPDYISFRRGTKRLLLSPSYADHILGVADADSYRIEYGTSGFLVVITIESVPDFGIDPGALMELWATGFILGVNSVDGCDVALFKIEQGEDGPEKVDL